MPASQGNSRKRASDQSEGRGNISASSSETWFRAVFEGSRDAIFLADEDARFIDVNSAAARLTGYSVAELKRMSMPDLHDEEELHAFREHFESIMAGRPATSEASVRRKDGVKVVAEFSNQRIEIAGVAYMHTVARDVTQRKLVEARLLETADRFRLLAAATGDAVYDVDLVNGRVWRNELYQRLFDAPRENPLTANWWHDRIHPDDRQRVLDTETEVYVGQLDGFVDEYRLRRPDGTYAHVVDRAYLQRDSAGKPIRKIGALTDITERKQVEEALRRSEERLEQALEGAGLGLWDHNFKTDQIFRSRRWAEMLGYSPDEIESGARAWKDLVHPDDLAETERISAEHEAGRTPVFRVEHRMRAKSGEWRWILNWGRVVERDSDGVAARAVGIHMDVTDFRRAEEALRESEERYRTIFENAAEGILITDLESREIRYANPASCAMFGYSRDEFRGMHTFKLHPLVTHEQMDRVFTEALRSENMDGADSLPCVRRDGALIYVDLYPAVVSINGRKSIVAFFTDITAQKAAAEELVKHREHLEELVERRTIELEASRARIRQAERLASIGTLAAGIAHEINNPLGMIMLGLEETRAVAPRSAKLEQILTRVKGDVKRCARIVKSVLRFARAETSEKWSEDLNGIIRSSLDFTREHARRHNVALIERLAVHLPRVLVNATEMEQVFVNLIHNAVHASEPGGGVSLATHAADNRVRAVVRDQGKGMTPEQIERAFDPFYTTRLEDGGTGLGLSTCHGIVAEHGGTISIQSEKDGGVSVTVDLPMVPRDAVEEAEHGAIVGG